MMQLILGVCFHLTGGFAAGSFYIPYKKVKGWAWESYWITGGIFSWLILPPLAAWLTIPDFILIIRQADAPVLGLTFLFGLLWGIGGLTFGLGLRYLGIALGSSVMLGLTAVFGALLPALYYDHFPEAGKDGFSLLISSTWGRVVLLGLLLCILGILLCGRAGMMKERDLRKVPGNAGAAEFRLLRGLAVALVSGMLSACFAFGIAAGNDMSRRADLLWRARHAGQGAFLYQHNVTYVVLLWGGLATNLCWCLLLNIKNGTISDYTAAHTPLLRNYLFCAAAGTAWFLQFFFYGMGESRLGSGASSWILHMAFIILTANVWGLILKEWTSAGKQTFRTVMAGILLIMLSIVVIGYGNSIKVST